MISASMAAIVLVSSEVRLASYDLQQSCTTDEAQTVVKKRTKMHCAAACSGQLGCREYNFDDATEDCSLYKDRPLTIVIHPLSTAGICSFITKDCSLYKHNPLFFEARPGCSRYKARLAFICLHK